MPGYLSGKDRAAGGEVAGEGSPVKESRVQEDRSSGVQEDGVQEFRSSGVQEFRSSGVRMTSNPSGMGNQKLTKY